MDSGCVSIRGFTVVRALLHVSQEPCLCECVVSACICTSLHRDVLRPQSHMVCDARRRVWLMLTGS